MIEWIFSFSHLEIELKFKISLFKIKLLLCDLSFEFYMTLLPVTYYVLRVTSYVFPD